jgi:hypothetical protein
MPSNYRRPGVYLEEAVLRGPGEVGFASAVTLFAGYAAQGPTNVPVRLSSWSEYTAAFGGFDQPADVQKAFLPYALFSYFQNGGRNAYVIKAVNGDDGAAAEVEVGDGDTPTPGVAFTVTAKSDGVWGNTLKVGISYQQSSPLVYTILVYMTIGSIDVEVERFNNLSLDGTVPGTKRADAAVNDQIYGSKYIRIEGIDAEISPEDTGTSPLSLSGGVNGGVPTSADLSSAVNTALDEITGPVVVNIVGHLDSTGDWVSNSINPAGLDRGDVFVINDNFDARPYTQTSAAYGESIKSSSGSITAHSGSSYVAAYTPWIVVPDPAVNGGTITIPPGGAVAGVFARTDATSGVYQSPAGVTASVSNALNVDAKFSDALLGDLNSINVNVLRPVAGQGICIMGGRTRKNFGVDRYINARRTLIYVKETLRNSTQFALFQNNNEALWADLYATADRVLRPIWNSGGLRGTSTNEAYFIVCDETINTPDVIASGEVRMEIGLALEYPAEFIVIRVSQFDGGRSTAEIIS